MSADGFWLFDGLEDVPYGLLPLVNLNSKGGASSTKNVERIGSYQWRLEDDDPVILVPGQPMQSGYWPGGKLSQDHGVLVYDVNHLKVKDGPLDTAILAARFISEKKKKPINFDEYDFITDAVNLQKLFAFAQEAGEGLFRIDCERVGKTVLMTRMEASDLMEIGHVTFDQNLKARINKPRSKHTTGPFFQLVSYKFGDFKILVRYEVDSADYAAVRAADPDPSKDPEKVPEAQKFSENENIKYIEFGETLRGIPLQLLTTYPQGAGFPFFTWAQLFFTAADQEIVGFFKGNGDFGKPAIYPLTEISKLMKPLPYVVLSKVHDSLNKIRKFLLTNDPDFRFGLIWKGKPNLEIYAKHPSATGALTSKVRELLAQQCKEPVPEDQ
ncbi:unnamed protein product [Bursaphelenchus okinawaensis]|uniref:Uncharacterized protein n=1 Tax=Bursaphelenchus okinawaensis TaxID=465554 RepID=A0A811K8F8_9BILA|nr:unnamed protein product [Bursaphelenchus okinawaensis]CAG9094024.1 unnamed protein product [Bursaphelenchus okinawaensis]